MCMQDEVPAHLIDDAGRMKFAVANIGVNHAE